MKQIAVIILNFLNYKETQECVNCILQQEACEFHIVVVDNGSDNESYNYLKKLYNQFNRVSIIRSSKNYGFAKGNNIGINYARNYKNAKYVLLLNSDTIIEDKYFLSKMMCADDKQIGAIGSRIMLPNGVEQKWFKRYVTFPGTFYLYMALWAEYRGFSKIEKKFKLKIQACKSTDMLQGCALLLTPDFFKYYSGLFAGTFLYCEEEMLYLKCKKVGLIEKKIDNTWLIHKEGQSAKLFYAKKGSLYDKYMLSSYKFVMFESLKDFLCCRK